MKPNHPRRRAIQSRIARSYLGISHSTQHRRMPACSNTHTNRKSIAKLHHIQGTQCCHPHQSTQQNVRLLLGAGADPNGISLRNMEDYSVRFIRCRHLKNDVSSFGITSIRERYHSQTTCPLTQAELDERSHGFPRFWTEPNVPGQRLRMGRALTALAVTAKVGNLEIFDILRAARADKSA
ncbi:hypothetical protein N7444_011007 [Penicillium canescens]|nr:hypothetical protein N7444_011007 [Penicillium canescens]